MSSIAGGGRSAGSRAIPGYMKEYYARQIGLETDPDLMSARSIAMNLGKGLDLLNAPRIQARRSADEAQQGISSALASRGGGQFADALLQGTRSRVGTELAGLLQGQQAELGMRTTRANLFHQIGATKQSLMNALFGAQSSFLGSAVQGTDYYNTQMAKLQWEQLVSFRK